MTDGVLRFEVVGTVSGEAVFRALCGDASDVFWLDGGPTSYVGAGERWVPEAPVLEALRRELGTVPRRSLALVGWLGYELLRETVGSDAPLGVRRRSPHADAAFLRVTRAVEVSRDGRATLVALGDRWEGDLERWRQDAVRVLGRLAAHGGDGDVAAASEPPGRTTGSGASRASADECASAGSGGGASADGSADPARPGAEGSGGARSEGGVGAGGASAEGRGGGGGVAWRDSDAGYLAKVAACQAAIRAGDAYVLNLTTEAVVEGRFDPVEVHARLRRESPSEHGALLRIGGVSLVSSSPEVFLEIEADGILRTSPVKGTRGRDPDAVADARAALELAADPKERAENTMIVDLMRNDLARVCVSGSVQVSRMLAVETHAQVHQLVSTVEGRLRPGLGVVDAIEATFPAGSMTGTPKRSAVTILDRLEARPRGLYAGAFGQIGFGGRTELAMTIRSIVIDNAADQGRGRATIGVGGGITALSDPASELAETKLKAAALLRALDR